MNARNLLIEYLYPRTGASNACTGNKYDYLENLTQILLKMTFLAVKKYTCPCRSHLMHGKGFKTIVQSSSNGKTIALLSDKSEFESQRLFIHAQKIQNLVIVFT